ncbi:MAG TPA: Hsp20/alpha crystallin family protein [Candidatus Faecimorpha stercoravium]|jgi:HSP20 family protein|nr:Hsp20/alpha crystallin family protein [Candidatus Faecimorpha stercoravium]
MLPSIFGESLLDDWFDFPSERDFFGSHNPVFGKHAKNLMRTDIRETDTSYELDVDLPGFKKEDIKAQVENGYLTISAAKGVEKKEDDKKGQYIRQERFSGACSRSFYVGDNVTEQDITAKFEDGILKLSIPKKDQQQVETKKYIAIE